MKTSYIILFILFIVISFTQCQPEEETPSENEAIINITSPGDNEEFGYGETVNIQATVTAEKEVHGYKIEIADSEGTVVYETDEHTHGTALTIDEEWTNDIEEIGVFSVSITVALDHDGNLKKESVNIICNAQ